MEGQNPGADAESTVLRYLSKEIQIDFDRFRYVERILVFLVMFPQPQAERGRSCTPWILWVEDWTRKGIRHFSICEGIVTQGTPLRI